MDHEDVCFDWGQPAVQVLFIQECFLEMTRREWNGNENEHDKY